MIGKSIRMNDGERIVIDKNILSSTHISFLFGAGVNGSALPQLSTFVETKSKLKELGFDISDGIESAIDQIEDSKERDIVKKTFVDEFRQYHSSALEKKAFSENTSIKNIEMLLKKIYLIEHETQNRDPSMKQINIYTLNYDTIIENILEKLGYLYNAISASNNSSKAGLIDVIGYDYNIKRYIPTFMISKLHGDIEKPIIPGKAKYKEILNEDYFEVAFNMKEQLCRPNSILIIIGYSGRDKHINKILEDCLNAGLTIYWYKYSESDYIPFDDQINIIIRDQDDYDNKKDTTFVCYQDMEKTWAEKSERL